MDRTDPTARAQGQRRAQEENENRMRELREEMERNRQQALRDAQEQARIDDDKQRRQLDRQRREREERERKQKEEERFCVLKDELLNYDFQTSPRIRKESFRDLMVNDIDVLRIALIGPTGSGKTSFVGKNLLFLIACYVNHLPLACEQALVFEFRTQELFRDNKNVYVVHNIFCVLVPCEF